jgi:hypothetical protein
MLDVLPIGMEWLVLLRTAPPGTLIWGEAEQAETGEEYFVFALREDSWRIKQLPQTLTGGVLLDVRMGIMNVTTESGQKVAYVPVLMKAHDLYETNFNVLHFDDHTMSLLGQAYVILFVGDSGNVERSLWFPPSAQLEMIGKRAKALFDEDPWTDPDFDEAKAIVMDSYPLEDLWEALGQPRRD